MKGLTNIKNHDNKCFLWCHISHLNPQKIHLERITKADKNLVNDLDYEGIKFPVSRKNYCKIEKKNIICIHVFSYENDFTYPFYESDQKFKMCMDLLLITDECNAHYAYIKDFNRFMCNKKNIKIKNIFENVV